MADRRIARSTSVKGMELLNLPLWPLIVLSFFNGTCLYCPGPGLQVGREHEENTRRAECKGRKRRKRRKRKKVRDETKKKKKKVFLIEKKKPGIFLALFISH